jgi:hypothetical protein
MRDAVARGARIKEILNDFRPLDTMKSMLGEAKGLTREK